MSDSGRLLKDKVVVITGSGRGIGAACARYVAACGATVVVNDVDAAAAEQTAEDLRGAGAAAVALACDLSDWDQATGLVDRAVERFGVIDGLMNNAARFAMARIPDSDARLWSRLIATNVLGTAACGQRAAAHMLRQGHGSIINVTSGAQSGLDAMSVYGATKGAVASLTYAWAVELAATPVRVNAISPVAATAMTETLRAFAEREGSAASVGSRPDAERVAPVVAFLLSDLSEGVSGQVVRVGGDEIALIAHPTVVAPSLAASPWTPQLAAEAFSSAPSLAPRPLGIVGSLSGDAVHASDPRWRADFPSSRTEP